MTRAVSKEAVPPPGAVSETAEKIVHAARQHFFLHGFRGVTMDDIAAELGMSKKTLYSCFSSKTALLEAVLQAKMRDVDADLALIGANPKSDQSTALEELLACMQKHGEEIHAPFVRDVRREAPELFQLVEKGRRALMQRHFTRILEAGRRSGVIRTDIPPEIVIDMLLASVDAIVNPTRMDELAMTPKEGFSAVLRIVLEGVLQPKRRRSK